MRKSLLVVLLLWIAVIVVIASCMKSTNVEQTNLHTSNINVGKVHNKVLESLEKKKNPLFNEKGLVSYADLVSMMNDIKFSMTEQGFDPVYCDAIIPQSIDEFTKMGLIKDIDGQLFLDLREVDFPLVMWDYLVINGMLDQGVQDKLSPIMDIYLQNGDPSELSAAVAELNTNLNLYDPDQIAKILTFKDIFEHSHDYWELYGITGSGSTIIADALGGIFGGIMGGLAGNLIVPGAGGIIGGAIGSGAFGGGCSYLQHRFLLWYNAQ
ncbi:MAG: hypothetical protein PHQ29_02700 [Candidatus Cloacimonetes bacterium]|jgi:hypothetical protein|nr:hypothetical protein [Candidatus Cloacimonadota bacterium]